MNGARNEVEAIPHSLTWPKAMSGMHRIETPGFSPESISFVGFSNLLLISLFIVSLVLTPRKKWKI